MLEPEDQRFCNAHMRSKPELIYFASLFAGSIFDLSVNRQRSSNGHQFGLLVPEKKHLKI